MPDGDGRVCAQSSITMSPCSKTGAIESPLIVMMRNSLLGLVVILRSIAVGMARFWVGSLAPGLIHCAATGTGGYVDKGNLGAAFARAGRRRQLALMSMAFNLGAPRLGGFRRMRAAIQSGDWHQAAREALDSRWASQVGTRAGEIADMLCSTKPMP